MTSTSSSGASLITLQFTLDLNIDVAEQEVQAAINAAANFLPRDLPNPPIYSKVNPADAPILTLALTSDTLPLSQGPGPRRHQPRAEDLAAPRRRPGQHQRRPEARPCACRPIPRRSPSYGLSLEDVRVGARRRPTSTRRRATSTGRGRRSRSAPTISSSRAAEYRPLVVAYRNGAPGAARRTSPTVDRRRRERPAGGVDERQARGDRQHPAPARRQHHRGRRPHQGAAAAAQGVAAVRRSRSPSLTDRTDDHPRLGATTCSSTLLLTVGAGGDGDLPVPAQPVGHDHSRASPCRSRSSARSASMYLLGYSLNNLSLMALTISTGFVVDDAIVMIENIARYIEEGESPLRGGAQGRRADRLHDRVAHRVADRGADPAAVHGRHRRPAVPRVRGHAQRDDPRLGGRLAHADADDVRQAPAAPAGGRAGPRSTGRPSAASTA